ncbi:hypothetical protein ACHQM5_021586 [Ranunculus cassubicifolius]
MKTISWNCRGLGNDLTVRHLRDLCRNEKPDILFLSETMIDKDHVNILSISNLFSNFIAISSCNNAGGLALFWLDNVRLEVISSCKHHINTLIKTGLSQSNGKPHSSMEVLTTALRNAAGTFLKNQKLILGLPGSLWETSM